MPDHISIICGHCGKGVGASVVAVQYGNFFLMCPACNEGSVRVSDGTVHPTPTAGRQIDHLPSEVEKAWYEVRRAFGAGAFTASEMMCRKILMHLAVDVAGSGEGKRFVEYVDDLQEAGFIVKGLEDLVDQIRRRGNDANHKLPASSEVEAHATLGVTEYLLQGIYELRNLAVTPLEQ